MNSTAELRTPRRPYRQTARAKAAEATADRILEAFAARLRDGWFDEIRLDDVARDAGVAVQTIIRRFGGKEGLLDATVERVRDEVLGRRDVAAGDVAGAIRVLIEDYEALGDLVLRSLAQEDRYPAIRRMTDVGRAEHRAWIAHVFSPWLATLPPDVAQARLDSLVVATDLYVWKLIRRDMARPVAELKALMARLIPAALAGSPFPLPVLESCP